MTPYTRNLHQDATYWPPGTPNGLGGLTFSSPVPIKCRWQDAAVLFRDAAGNQVTSSAIVYVDRQLAVQGYLFLGTSVVADPRSIGREVRQTGSSPNLKATKTLHKVWL